MKKLIFELKDSLYDLAFRDEIIKGRTPILLIVIEACRYMMHNVQVSNANHNQYSTCIVSFDNAQI